jgi:fatty-acyl-CoA synthase
MRDVSLIDEVAGALPPRLDSADAVAELESVPYDQRVSVASTYEALTMAAQRCGDLTALHFLPHADPAEEPVSVCYADFMRRVTQTANWFHDLGVRSDEVVSLLMPLLPESFYALFGAQAAGIANPVNPLLSASQTLEILRAANTKVLVTVGPAPGSDIWEKVQSIRQDLPSLQTVIVVGGPTDLPAHTLEYGQHIDRYRGDALDSGRVFLASDTASYFHTGGTTGLPKLVVHSHRNEVYQAWVIGTMLNTGKGRNLLFGLPLFHVGGALTQALGPLCCGSALVVLSPAGWRHPNALKNVWALVQRYQPLVFGAVPTVLGGAALVPVDQADQSSIAVVSGGGAAIPVAVCQHYAQQLGVPVLEVYGMTETSSVHTIGYRDRPVRLGSVGFAVPYSRVRVVKVDAQGRLAGECAVDEIGVVVMSGPGVTSGYVSPEHNREAFVEAGWINSGDLGRIDAQGYIWITGRAKDLVIRGGHNIDPQAVEETFYQHPCVALVAVVGQPDAYAGELPVAYVQRKTGDATSEADLLAFVKTHTPERAAVPVQVYFIDAIPLTAVGKVFKPALRWDAAQRMATRLLADLETGGVAVRVNVQADGTHGSIMRVQVTGAHGAQRQALAAVLAQRLGPLTLAHEVSWS